MENFIVSARKYRPTTFDSVVGQEAITQTLQNAIHNNHLAQALLFCGPRGVGKTTCARILAKAINLSERPDEVAIDAEGDDFSFNIFELDAASNNSVEDIRNLIDQVRFPPQVGTFKVYIIDEVHMLSQAAFNAFLKTLEEPPKHAIFILATTEKHKIIPTILSRCQVFDFNRIQIEDIAKHLASIAEKEGISAEPDALHIIAEKADGALRDALSMFDQIVSYSGNTLTYKATIDNLNILDYDYYFKITQAIIEGDIPNALLLFNEILSHGFDGHNFIVGLEQHFRNLVVCLDASTLQLLEVGANIKERYSEQASLCELPFLMKSLEICNQCDVQYKSSKNQRLLVEISLMQLCSVLTSNSSLSPEKKKTEPIAAPKPRSTSPSTSLSEEKAPVQPPEHAPIEAMDSRSEEAMEKQQEKIKEKPDPEQEAQKVEMVREPNPSFQASLSGRKTGSSFSIQNYIKKEEKAEEQEEEKGSSEVKNEDYSEGDLLKIWKELAQKAETDRNFTLFSILNKTPVIRTPDQIEITLDNKAQEEEFMDERMRLQEHLRQALKRSSIRLETKISRDESSKKAYTAAEKFKKMADKNPNLNELKDQLGLELNL